MVELPTLPLIDLLRQRRGLGAREVALLLAEFSAMLQEVGERPANLLRAVCVVFPAGHPAVRLAAEPVTAWPPFRLLWRDESARDGSTMDGFRTAMDAPAQLAALLYDLLGGRRRGGAKSAFSPLTALNEAGNDVLRDALHGGAFADCDALWRAWAQTLETPAAVPPPEWRIPPALREAIEQAEVIELLPEMAMHQPVRLVARDRFFIGRSRLDTDWPARGPRDDTAPLGVSRLHLTGLWLPDGPAFCDGDGVSPSKFGTTCNGTPLAAGELRPLCAGGSFVLGGEYRLETWRVRDAGFCGFMGPDVAADARRGAVFFQTLEEDATLRDAVWLGSEIAFCLTASGGMNWGCGHAGGEHAWFLYRHGHFWLANRGFRGARIQVAGIPLEPGEVAPLATGQALVIGPRRFSVSRIA